MSRNSASVAAAVALLFVAWSAVSERSAAGEMASDARPTGYVSPTEARFEIPLPPQAQWEWGSPDTPPNQLEYAWLLRIGSEGDEHHGLGFMRFRHASDQPRSGGFPDLLRAGQLDLWELERGGADGGRLIRSVRVEGYVDGGRLIVVLRDQDAIRSIFAGRPPVTLQETVYPAAPRNTEVAVQYTGI
jgi:hypothetical protein